MTKSSKNLHTLTSLKDITSYEAGITQASAFRLIKKITDTCLSEYEISTMQWYVIGLVHDAGSEGISVTKLSQLLGTNIPYITNTINVLVERNIIIRTSPRDNNRQRILHICPEYIPMVSIIEARLRTELRATIYASVTQAELLNYINVLYKFNSLR